MSVHAVTVQVRHEQLAHEGDHLKLFERYNVAVVVSKHV